ncbi:MAG TPA: hypothetical protein VFJ47_13820, partial [Terriglobales bacterium]|nr:hypothetical protein [Terriglobales bacterium]
MQWPREAWRSGRQKPGAGSRKPEAGCRKPGAGSRLLGFRAPEAGRRKPIYRPLLSIQLCKISTAASRSTTSPRR